MLNPFISQECARLGLAQNVIPTALPETYSQAGEDLLVEALLTSVAFRAGPIGDLCYVEIGANHPVQTSNTYLFYLKYNARGVLFEADPELIPQLRQARPRDVVVHAAVSAREAASVVLTVSRAKELSSVDEGHVRSYAGWADYADVVRRVEVPNVHVRDVLESCGRTVHYLSVDVEGLDLEILRAVDFVKHRPWVVSCESSAHYRPDNPAQLFEVMTRNGYVLAARTFVNMIFVDQRLLTCRGSALV